MDEGQAKVAYLDRMARVLSDFQYRERKCRDIEALREMYDKLRDRLSCSTWSVPSDIPKGVVQTFKDYFRSMNQARSDLNSADRLVVSQKLLAEDDCREDLEDFTELSLCSLVFAEEYLLEIEKAREAVGV